METTSTGKLWGACNHGKSGPIHEVVCVAVISEIQHSRHRSPVNFCVNILYGLIAYCHQPKKPSLHLDWLLPQSA